MKVFCAKRMVCFVAVLFGLVVGHVFAADLGVTNGVVLWLKADAITGMSDGEAVTTWEDQSANANHATGGVSPSYAASGINGQPSVSFSGLERLLTGVLTPDWPGADCTVFIVADADAMPQVSDVLQALPDSITNRFRCGFSIASNVEFDYGDATGIGHLATGYVGGTGAGILNLRMDAIVGQSIYWNGMRQAASGASDTFVPAGKQLEIGDQFQGDVAEIIIYNRALSGIETMSVGSYLEQKYRLATVYTDPAALPVALGGLQLWLSAETVAGLTNNGTVDTWYDASGHERNVTNTAGAVQWRENAISGEPALAFRGGDALMRGADGLGLSGSPAMTVVTVSRSDAQTAQRLAQLGALSGAGGQVMAFGLDGSVAYNDGGRGFDADFTGVAHIGVWTREAGDTYGDAGLVLDGASATESAVSNGAGTLALADEALTVGAGIATNGALTEFVSGDVAEILVYDRVLTPEEQNALGGYLTRRYGLTDTHYAGPVDPAEFTHDMTIAFPGYDRGAVLTDFPVLLRLTDAIDGFDYGDFSSTNGFDLRLTDDTGTNLLFHEIVTWDTSSESLVWVRIPELRRGTTIKAYWGNAELGDAPAYYASGRFVWDDNFFSVLPMGNTGTELDATGNGIDATVNGATNAEGIVATGKGFDGNDDYLNFGDVAEMDVFTQLTCSLWFKRRTDRAADVSNHNISNMLLAQSSNAENDNLEIGTQGVNVQFYIDDADPDGGPDAMGAGVSDNVWHHLSFVYDQALGKEARLYLNGKLVEAWDTGGGPPVSSDGSPLTLGIARPADQAWGDFDGLMDEVRLSLTARSAAWTYAEYMTVGRNAAFTQYGTTLTPGDFAQRMRIEFAYDGTETLEDFPALVKFSEDMNFSYSQFGSPADGSDLRFTDETGVNILAYDIESWDTNGTSCVWVRIPELTSNCVIWAHWGNADYPRQPYVGTQTWLTGYQSVHHLNETSGTHADATGYGRHLAVFSNYVQDAEGVIAGGAYGSGEQNISRLVPVNMDDGLYHNPFSVRTVSAWVTLDVLTGPSVIYEQGGTTAGMTLAFRTTPQAFVLSMTGGGNETEVTGATRFYASSAQPIHVAAVYDHPDVRLYVNGHLDASGALGSPTAYHTSLPGIGGSSGDSPLDTGTGENQAQWHGTIDEVRIADAARSADWLTAAYANVADYDAFVIQQMVAIENAPATGIGVDSATLNASLEWDDGQPTEVSVFWGTADGGAALGGWQFTNALSTQAVGAASEVVSGLARGTRYFYRFYATNSLGAAWSDATSHFLTLPTSLGGLAMWLSPDALPALNDGDAVDAWPDWSGKGNHAVRADGAPVYVADVQNGVPGVRLSGTNDTFFCFPRMTDIRSVVIVAREDLGATGPGFLLGDEQTYDFHRGTSNRIWSTTYTHRHVLDGRTAINGVTVDGATVSIPTNMSILTVVTAGDVTASALSKDRQYAGRIWDGDIQEVMVFTRVLQESELNEIGASLAVKYGLDAAYDEEGPLVPSEFSHRMRIRFDGYTGSSTLWNFPALVRLGEHINGFSYGGFESPTGGDLRFADSDGVTPVAFDIDAWDEAGTSAVWVRVPGLTSTSEIWAYWGSSVAATNTSTVRGVGAWHGSYDAVWHMRRDLEDSTGHGNDGIGTNLINTTGMIADAQAFNDYDAFADVGDSSWLEHANGVTVEAWMRNDSLAGVQRIFHKNPGYSFGINGNRLRFTTLTVKDYESATGVIQADTWHHVAAVLNTSDNVRFYVDGLYIGNATHTASGKTGVGTAYLSRPDLERWDGVLDELRVSAAARSDDWILATYETVANHDAFTTYEPLVTADGAENVTSASADLQGTVHLTNGGPSTVTLYYGAGDAGLSASGWGATNVVGAKLGSFSVPVSWLAEGATTYFRFHASNTTQQAWSGVQVLRTLIGGVDGVVLWLDANEIASKADGDSIDVWRDLSGNANHATQIVPLFQPAYGATALGGKPAVSFGPGETMPLGATVAAQGSTVFIIQRQSPYQAAWSSSLGGDLCLTQDDQQWAVEKEGGSDINIRPVISSTTFSVNAMQLVQRDYRFWVNGKLESTSLGTATLTPFTEVGYDFQGEIAEVIVFDRMLGVSEHNAIGTYLGQKYGVDTRYEEGGVELDDFTFKVPIDIAYDRGDVLTNFPVFVELNSNVSGFAPSQFESPWGYDLRFVDEGGMVQLNHEVEQWLRDIPIAYYHFDNDLVDSGLPGNGYDGVGMNGAAFTTNTPSGIGRALDLTGANAHVVVPGWKGIGGRGARTISAWINVPPSSPTNAAILSWGQDLSGKKWVFRIQDSNGTSGALRAEINGGYVVGSTRVNDGAWHHVACVLAEGADNVNNVELYVDGILETRSATLATALDTDINAGLEVLIGNSHASQTLHGLMDELAVWDVALTGDEIAAVYNGGLPADMTEGLANDSLVVWVQIPTLTNNTRIWACWGNASATEPSLHADPTTAWHNGYDAVWHLNTIDAQDSTANGRNAASAGNPVPTDGLAFGDIDFDGTGDRITTTPNLTHVLYSVSAWARADVLPGHVNESVFNSGTTAPDFQWDNDGSNYRINADNGGATHVFGPIMTNEWVQLAMTCDGTNTMLYYNGELADTFAGVNNRFTRYEVGCNRAQNYMFDGQIDELRVMDMIAPSNWIWATYMNLASNGTFVARGVVDGPAPVTENLAATLITDTNAMLNGYLTVTGGAPTTVYVLWGTNDGAGAWGTWENTNLIGAAEAGGPVAYAVTGLTRQTSYHYAFYASNAQGVAWAQPSRSFTTLGTMYYTITPSSGPNGSISPAVAENLNPGDSSSFYTFAGDTGYHLTNVVVDGTNFLGALASHQFTTVTTNHTIQALFGPDSYTITVTQNAGGGITPTGVSEVVYEGSSPTFEIAPDSGSYLLDVEVDGESVGLVSSYQFTGVTTNHTITAEFAPYPDEHFPADSLVFWLAADTIDGSDGVRVETWRDFSGYMEHVGQPSGPNRPVYVANGVNGQPAVYFDSTMSLTSGFVHADWPASNVTVFVVHNVDRLTQNNRVFALYPETAATRMLAHLPWGQKATFDFGDHTTSGRVQTATFDAGTNSTIWSMSSELGGGEVIHLNGSVAATSPTADSIPIANRYFGIGNNSMEGHLAELLVFNRALDFAERSRVGFYLQQKYGIAGTHPDPTHVDIAVAAATDADLPRPGLDTFTYTITAANNGPTNATGVVVTNALPAGVTYVSDDSGDFDSGGLWNVGTLAYQGSTSVVVTCTLDYGTGDATLTNVVSLVVVDQPEWNGGNDTGVVAFTAYHETIQPDQHLRRMKITFPGYTKPETLINFTALVKLHEGLAGFRYGEFSSAVGGDLRFAAADGETALAYEIEEWDTAGQSVVWVNLPELSTNTHIWAYWGGSNSIAPSYTTNGGAWKDAFLTVTHLHAGSGADSTANGIDGGVSNAVSSAGVVGGGLAFDGDDDYVNFGDVDELDVPTRFTASLWFKRIVDGAAGAHGINNVLLSQAHDVSNDNIEFGTEGGNVEFYIDDDGADRNPGVVTGGVQNATWQHIALSYDAAQSNELSIYLDGVRVSEIDTESNGSGLVSSTTSPLGLGMSRVTTTRTGDFEGLMDEFRMSLTPRSSNWIWACYMNQATNEYDAFVGSEPVTGPPIISSLQPSHVARTSALFRGSLDSTGGAPVTVWLYWGENDGGDTREAWENTNALGLTVEGLLQTNITALTTGVTNYYCFFGSNDYGTAWGVGVSFRTAAAGEYALSFLAEDNGAVVPGGIEYVSSGGDGVSHSFLADTGYHVEEVTIDGSSVGAPTSYQFTNVTTDHTVNVTFALNSYTVTVVQTSGGTVTPTPVVVPHGSDSPVLSMTADEGYYVADVLVDGQSVGPMLTYQFLNVTNAGTIEATFASGGDMPVKSGLVLWLAADTLDATNGAPIDLWQDLSGEAHHVSQADPAVQPTLTNDVVNGGKPALNFAATQYVGRRDALGFFGDPAMSVVAVVRGPNADGHRYLEIGAVGGAGGRVISFGTDAAVRYNDGNRIMNQRQTGAFSIGTWTRVAGAAHNQAMYWQNGVPGTQRSTDNAPPNLVGLLDESTLVGVGRGTTGVPSNGPLDGQLAELLVFDRELTADDRRQIGRYLGVKYNIAAAFPDQPLPAGVDDPVLWLDGTSIYGVGDGEPLAEWTDVSGHGNSVTQGAVTNQPEYVADGVRGNPVVRFDGGDFLLDDTGLGLGANPALTIAAVLKGKGGNDQRFLQLGADDGRAHGVIAIASGVAVRHNGGSVEFMDAPLTGRLAMGVWLRDAGATYGSTAFYRNGGEVTATGSTNPDGTLTAFVDQRVTVGAGQNVSPTPNDWFNGEIAEIIVYSRRLSDSERGVLEGYLDAKYGLQGMVLILK